MKKSILILCALLSSLASFSQNIDKLKLTSSEIPEKYSLTEDSQCISIQACVFYKNPDLYSSFLGKVKSKSIQNFENGKDSGSIMYFEFEKNFEGESFMKGLIWGGDKPTREHPEELFVKDNILIIWSFPLKNDLKNISKEKVNTVLK